MLLARGPIRELIDARELERLRPSGTVFVDERRSRPRYFDGRFLAARDLVRDQSYFLLRQADLGSMAGAGVAGGLDVSVGARRTLIRISAGHGFTSAGELCVVTQPFEIDLNNTALFERLNVALQLSRRPFLPLRTVTGLFILSLRPVEFTANPIASFPTSVTGERTVTDGDIIEGVAATITPFPVEGEQDIDRMRTRAAFEIFVANSVRGLSANALPLAMLGVRRGEVEFIDTYLVRRDLGPQQADSLGLGLAPRALRESHFRQYSDQLDEVLEERRRGGRELRFAASAHFQALPAVGQLPSASVSPADFSQSYFPPTVDCELAIVPEDELPGLLEEGLTLPPIDLTRTGEELDAIAVTIFVPVPRSEFRGVLSSLAARPRVLRVAAPGLLAKRRPLEILTTFRLPRIPELEADPRDQAWRQLLARTDRFWYMRRRALPYRTDLFGVSVALGSSEVESERAVTEAVAGAQAGDQFAALLNRATNQARGALLALLAQTAILQNPTLLNGVLSEVSAIAGTIDSAAVLRVGDRYRDTLLGAGLVRLETAVPDLRQTAASRTLGASRAVPELDRLAQRLEGAAVASFARTLADRIANGESPDGLRTFILERHGGLDQ